MGMAALDLIPDLVVTSTYVRARQTAEIAVRTLGCDDVEILVREALVPTADPERIVEVLREHTEDRSVSSLLCVGHAPNLDLVIAHLVGADQPFTQLKKAGLASIQTRGSTVGHAAGRLFALVPPSALRRIGQAAS